MGLVKPKKLNTGDVIGLVSPASSPRDLSRIEKSVKYFESVGYRVEIGKHVGGQHGYLSGTDAERLEDLHEMFRRKDINAVFCVRGGYGSPRLLSQIDYKLIAKNPKIFVGYSDITALSLAFLKKTRLVTFAGPMPAVDFHGEVDPYAEENFWAMLTSAKKPGTVPMPDGHELKPYKKGKASGHLVGGNLALVAGLAGSPYMPQIKGSILFLEDVGEPPYRIDRMLNQLKINGFFKKAEGVLLGQFTNCVESDPDEATLSLEQVINDYLADVEIPVMTNLPHGHVDFNFILPFGIDAKMNVNRQSITITEAPVSR